MINARRATADDAAELVRLRGVMLASMPGHRPDDGSWREQTRRILERRLTAPEPTLAAFVVDRPEWGGSEWGGSEWGGSEWGGPEWGGSESGGPKSGGSEWGGPESGGPGGLAACAVGTVEERLGNPNNPSGLVGYVFSVATDPDCRRRGYSRGCVTALLKWYDSRGVRTVDLRASADAESLYESLGFRRTADPAMRLHLPGSA